jgi:hypothetical protein
MLADVQFRAIEHQVARRNTMQRAHRVAEPRRGERCWEARLP